MRISQSQRRRRIARAIAASVAPVLILGLAIESSRVESAPVDSVAEAPPAIDSVAEALPSLDSVTKAPRSLDSVAKAPPSKKPIAKAPYGGDSAPPKPASVDQAPPRNDNLAAALPLRPAPFIDIQDTSAASAEPGEVMASCDDPGFAERGVWYVYEPAADGLLTLTTIGSEIDTVLSAWTASGGGAPAHPLEEAACNDDAFGELTSALVLRVRAGEPVYVKVAGQSGMTGRIQLHVVAAPAAPLHDNRVAARPVETLPFAESVWTATATDETDEVRSACAPVDGGPERGVWYRIGLPAGGAYVQVDSGRPAIVSAWSADGLVERDCAAGGLVLEGEPGETVLVKIADPDAGGPILVRFDARPPAPGNDNLADAERLSLLPVNRSMPLWTASDEPDEARASCAAPEGPEHSVWYHYTAPVTGVVIADALAPGAPGIKASAAVISAWSGEGSHPLVEIACARSDGLGAPDHLALPLVEGEVIYFKIGAASSSFDDVSFNLLSAPPNDDLINATPVVALPFVEPLLPRYSSLEPDEAEPSCAEPTAGGAEGEGAPGSLWYRIDSVRAGSIVVSSTLAVRGTASLWSSDAGDSPTHPLVEIACASGAGGAPPILIATLSDPGPTWLRLAPFDQSEMAGVVTIFDAGPVPENDARSDATLVASLPFTSTTMTFSASDDEDEPRPSCATGGAAQRGVWYSYTPSSAARLTVSVHGSSFPVLLSAWETIPGFPPRELACAGPGAGPWPDLRLEAESGREILIKAAGVGGAAGSLWMSIAETPVNDDLLDAIPIGSLPFRDNRPIYGSTQELGEAYGTCGEYPGAARGVWYLLSAPSDGAIEISTVGSSFDTVLSLWRGGVHPLEMIECMDDAEFSVAAVIVWSARAGETVWIKAGGFGGSVGNLVLSVSPPALPPTRPINDDLADALDVSRPGFTSRINTVLATEEPDELTSGCMVDEGYPEPSVWYRFTASQEDNFTFDTHGSDFDTVLSAWRGVAHPLEEIACNDDDPETGFLSSSLALDLAAGETIHLKVSPLSPSPGGIVVFSREGERILLPLLTRNARIGRDD